MKWRWNRTVWRRRMVRAAVGGLVAAVLLSTAFAIAVFAVDYPVETLKDGKYSSLIIRDRNGVVLRQVNVSGDNDFSPRHRFVRLDEVDARVIATLLASEDQHFFTHSGVDVGAVFRAMGLNLLEGGVHYGASTITMQLMRNVHSRGKPRSLWNKLQEMVLALRVERAVDKRFILEQYLNRVYFGNGAFGIEAAAQRYFGKRASALSAGEATYLCVLPRGPSYYDPFRHHRRVLTRRDHLLNLMVSRGTLSKTAANQVRRQRVSVESHPFSFRASHFVDWVMQTLPEDVRAEGGVVTTTLDWWMQEAVAHATREHVAALRHRGVEQAGVVVLDAQTGKVLAMVGATSSAEEGGSDVNIVTRRRYPGSSLKPFVYATAIEQGDSPATLAEDMMTPDSAYQVSGRPPKEHGVVRFREALAGSYNIAAVHVLEKVGVSRVMEKLRRAGVSDLQGSAEDYGLRLALGDTKVRLVDLAAGYGFLVREGKVISPTGIEQVTFYGQRAPWQPVRRERQVFQKQVAWLTMDMLSDPEARRKVFGQETPADLPYAVAVKTGTARGFSDTVAVFATNEFVVAAWTGRFDGNPTRGVLGMSGAAPLARDALLIASRGKALTLPQQPPGIESALVCPTSGKRVSRECPHQMREYFLKGRTPAETCDHQSVAENLK